MRKYLHIFWLASIMLCLPHFVTLCAAESLQFHEVFSSHMVLPKNKTLRVFERGEGKVKVTLAGKRAKARAVDGQWLAELPPMKAGGPYRLTVQSKDGKVELEDVWIGMVVVAAGQSNMQFKLKESSTPPSEWKGDPLVRSFSVRRIEKGEPHTPEEGWLPCTKHSDHFHPAYAPFNKHGILYETMVKAIAPYPVSHVAWYQGESNTGVGEYRIYPELAKAMVECWREVFKDKGLPFTMVQIANLKGRGDEVGWKNIQQAQMRIPYAVEGVQVVRSSDVCEDNNIHPMSKEALARRIADTIK